MTNTYFTVGPSQPHPNIRAFIEDAMEKEVISLSHIGNDFENMYERTASKIKKLLTIPKKFHIFFTGSSMESMDIIVTNAVEKSSIHLIGGLFGQIFYNYAKKAGKDAVAVPLALDIPFNFDKLNISKVTELLCITENETTTGMRLPMLPVSEIKRKYPNLLVAVDIVSSAPYVTLDFSIIDIAFFSVQKGFGMPSGMGVLIVSDAAIQKAQDLENKGYFLGNHHSLTSLVESEKNWHCPSTPNVLSIFLLEKILDNFLETGISIIRKETEEKANALYSFFKKQGKFVPLVHENNLSITTPVFDARGKSGIISQRLADRGFFISKGFGQNPNQTMRIANYPSTSIDQMMMLCQTIEECTADL